MMETKEDSPPADVPPASPPSSTSTGIEIGSTPEEELYRAAGLILGRHNGDASSLISRETTGSVETKIEPRDSGTSADFAFETDMSKYPASMTSSVRAHVYEGGLRYHAYKDGKYVFPNDETEQNRDDMKHTMTLMLCRGAFHYAPVEEMLENGGEVLDLGE